MSKRLKLTDLVTGTKVKLSVKHLKDTTFVWNAAFHSKGVEDSYSFVFRNPMYPQVLNYCSLPSGKIKMQGRKVCVNYDDVNFVRCADGDQEYHSFLDSIAMSEGKK